MIVAEILRPQVEGPLQLALCDANRNPPCDAPPAIRVDFRAATPEAALGAALRFIQRHGLADATGLEIIQRHDVPQGPSIADLITLAQDLVAAPIEDGSQAARRSVG